MRRTFVAAAGVTMLLAACADGTGIAPQASLQDPNQLSIHETTASVPAGVPWPALDWWTRYGDEQLNQLIREGLNSSPTPRLAAARMRKAAAITGFAAAERLPRLDARIASTYQHFSGDDVIPPPYAGTTGTESRASLELFVPLDLWGGREAEYRAALGNLRANEIELQAARLDLATAIARAYAQLAAESDQLEISRDLLRQKHEIAALSSRLAEAGLVTAVEAEQVTAATATTEAEIAQGEERASLLRQRLAVLAGAGPDRGQAIGRPHLAGEAVRGLPSLVPVELIGRRPEIVAQRWRIEAASREIVATKARFYPNVDLSAFIGLSSIGLDRLLNASSGIAGIGPAISLPIFDSGRLRSDLARADAEHDIAVEQYNIAVIEAVQDVVGQLTTWHANQVALAQEHKAVAGLERAYRLALLRYGEGLSNYLTVLSAQGELIAERRKEAEARSRQTDASMALAHALGGGFAPVAPSGT